MVIGVDLLFHQVIIQNRQIEQSVRNLDAKCDSHDGTGKSGGLWGPHEAVRNVVNSWIV